MELFRSILIWTHIIAGCIGLLVFWIPVFAKKGGKVHLFFGKIFAYCSYLVGFSALFISAAKLIAPKLWAVEVLHRIDPSAKVISGVQSSAIFLGYLSIVGLVSTRHAIYVIRARKGPSILRDSLHKALLLSCILSSLGVIAYGFVATFMQVLLFAMSPIGFLVGIGGLKFMRSPSKPRMAWWYEHMSAIFGAGIAFHTAFLVFGITRFVDIGFDGILASLPWVAPAIIGAPTITLWTRHYKKKFGDL
ncbi:MAG: hypothetical protein P1V97_09420 [Planctomycetota bacterium]|nr:hypothetical protein [Planctomycetota bacterium]